jgi:hypothetical protein
MWITNKLWKTRASSDKGDDDAARCAAEREFARCGLVMLISHSTLPLILDARARGCGRMDIVSEDQYQEFSDTYGHVY